MIREAKDQDLDFLVDMTRKYYEESGDGGEFHAISVCGVFNNLIVNDNAAIFVDEKMRGLVAGVVFPNFMSGKLMGNEMFMWFDKKGTRGLDKRLLQKLELWAMSKGAASFTMKSEQAKKLGYDVKQEYTRAL